MSARLISFNEFDNARELLFNGTYSKSEYSKISPLRVLQFRGKYCCTNRTRSLPFCSTKEENAMIRKYDRTEEECVQKLNQLLNRESLLKKFKEP